MHDTKQILTGLNEAQREAVTYMDGPLLVLAGPGSGKTRVITHRIAYMIAQGVPPDQIVGLTFTNKAAEEMRQRLQSLLGDCSVWLGTFHGFCVRLLRTYARLAGLPENFSIYDTESARALLKEALAAAGVGSSHVGLEQIADRISFFKNRLIGPDSLAGEALGALDALVAEVYPLYQRSLLRCGAVDFDDILMYTACLLRDCPDLRKQLDARWRYVLLDEYQDTNLAQYAIVRHLKVDYPFLTATGDPDQSIYGWRGATYKNVTYLERDYHNLHVVRLEANYRSTSGILAAADFLISHNSMRKPKRLVSTRGDGSPVVLAVYPTARQEAEDVVQRIVDAVEHGGQRFRDFGILYRTNSLSRLFEHALARRGIPYQVIGGFRFYQRKEIKDLAAYLLLLYNPADDLALQRALNTPPRGIGKKTVARLQQIAAQRSLPMLEACRWAVEHQGVSSRAAKALRSFLDLYDAMSVMVYGDLADLIEMVMASTQYREYVLSKNDEAADEILANLDELLQEARELDAAEHEDRPALERFLEQLALQSDVDGLALGSDCVTLMTLHAAKGLEFENVFIVGVEENLLPHARAKDDPLGLEEERRLLFVGMTRARNALQISYAQQRGFSSTGGGVPSSFLMELPRHQMVLRDFCSAVDMADQQDGTEAADDSWDDLCQLGPDEELAGDMDADWEFCQLPEEEMARRSGIGRQSKTRGVSPSRRDSYSHGASAHLLRSLRVGSVVTHEEYGSGRVVAVTGHGKKQVVTVDFFIDGRQRTFRVDHAPLTVESIE